MTPYRLERRLWLPKPPEILFPFFADARNLGAITPEWLHFEIAEGGEAPLEKGSRIGYRIRIRGFSLRWLTEISEWAPPRLFVDVQLKGPYMLWRHRHRFEPVDGGTLCFDEVDYYPMGGPLVHALFVRRDIERIFDYRAEKLKTLFV